MNKLSLAATVREHLDKALSSASGRSSTTVFGGHEKSLRQTVIAMTSGTVLGEHESPGEATVYVLLGRVRLSAGENSWDGRQGDLLVVPDGMHALAAIEDAAVLLTVAKLV